IGIGLTAVIVIFVIRLLPGKDGIAGFTIRQVGEIQTILFLSGLMSGLSGFGFSAVGAACLLLIAPILEVPLLQALSTCNQFMSFSQLRQDMPSSLPELYDGAGPCILGGLFGVPLGTWLLNHLPAKQLTVTFGTILVIYALYSIFR